MYTYGVEIEVLSDYKPLESIFKKLLFKVPRRLQRMRIRLQKYNVKVKCSREVSRHCSDTLPRAFVQLSVPTDDDMHHDMERLIHSVITNLTISGVRLMELRELKCNDPTMPMLHRYAMDDPWRVTLNIKEMYLLH